MMNFYESMESLTSSLHRWVAISWHIKGVRSNDPFKGSIHALEKLVENKKNHSLSCSCLPSAFLLPTRNFECWAYAFEIFDCLLADVLHRQCVCKWKGQMEGNLYGADWVLTGPAFLSIRIKLSFPYMLHCFTYTQTKNLHVDPTFEMNFISSPNSGMQNQSR